MLCRRKLATLARVHLYVGQDRQVAQSNHGGERFYNIILELYSEDRILKFASKGSIRSPFRSSNCLTAFSFRKPMSGNLILESVIWLTLDSTFDHLRATQTTSSALTLWHSKYARRQRGYKICERITATGILSRESGDADRCKCGRSPQIRRSSCSRAARALP